MKELNSFREYLNEAKNDVDVFQKKRINDFDELQNRLKALSKKLAQAKLETDRYYRENPKSYAVVYATDMINDFFNDIDVLLTQDN